MKHPEQVPFQLYRFQILPISRDILLTIPFHGKTLTLDELILAKNEIFAEEIYSIEQFDSPRTELSHRFLTQSRNGENIMFRIGAFRGIVRTNKNLEEERLDNWPAITVAINLNLDVQLMAVEKNAKVFKNTFTVARIIQDNVNRRLRPWNLQAYIEPLFNENKFWDLVDRYKGRITQVKFELISPNMSQISKKLNLNLKALNQSTNTQKTNLQLNSDPDGSLTISRDDKNIKDLVTYASEGGGNISIKARGVHRIMNTSKGISEIHIDELQIDSSGRISPEAILKALNDPKDQTSHGDHQER